MKKTLFLSALLVSVSLTICACGNSEAPVNCNAMQEENSSVESTDINAEDVASSDAPTESEWTAGELTFFNWPVNFSAFYTKDQGITIGFQGEIHYTTNAGADEYPRATNDNMNCCFGVEFVDEKIIYVTGNGKQVDKSTDGGKTFVGISQFGGTSPEQCRMISFIDETNGVIASCNKVGLTSDSGLTWKELTIPANVAGIEMLSLTDIYFIGSDLKLYKSNDAGATWTGIDMNLPEGTDYFTAPQSFAFEVDGEEIDLYVCQSSNRVLRNYFSADGGATWSEKPMPEVKGQSCLYLNNTGDILSAVNPMKTNIVVLTR